MKVVKRQSAFQGKKDAGKMPAFPGGKDADYQSALLGKKRRAENISAILSGNELLKHGSRTRLRKRITPLSRSLVQVGLFEKNYFSYELVDFSKNVGILLKNSFLGEYR